MDLSKLHVCAMISNPVRYKSRYRLYEQFKQHMEECGVNFWTVEIAFGKRNYEISPNLELRTSHELWHKENALNLMVARLPTDWEYVCWIDADIDFLNWRGDAAWYKETWHALQHHRIVQLFQNAVDLGPNGETLSMHQGFAYSWVTGRKWNKPYYGNDWHPGYAWAMRRETWEQTGGLIDWAILGAGDNHMAHAWIGKAAESVNQNASGPYFDALAAYQRHCDRNVRKDIGYVPGTITHHWHGKKKDRRYWDRWKILTETQFDPRWDIRRDWQGLYQLADHGDERSIILRDRIRQYFRARGEDSIDLE